MHEVPSVRLQKFLADAGLCSRRAAESLITAGEVRVNGTPATLGQRINPGKDRVVAQGREVRNTPQTRMTLAVNKPRGLVCSNDDPRNPDTVFDLLPKELQRLRFFCAGRLDKDSEGLMILTTDGDLANRLMHPRNTIVKRYQVRLEDSFPAAKVATLRRGVVIEGERHKVEYAALLNPQREGSSVDLDVWMHHGKKREIRLLFLALGFPVKRLRRYQIGAFPIKGIPLRGGKALNPREIELLFSLPRSTPDDVKSPRARRTSRSPSPRSP